MFNPNLHNPKTYQSPDDVRKSRETNGGFGSLFVQGGLPLRSKSTNIMNIPLKTYMGALNGTTSSRVDPVSHKTKIPTPITSTRNVEIRNPIRINAEGNNFESLNRKKITITPEKREPEKMYDKEIIFRTPDPIKNKQPILEPLSTNKLNFKGNFESVKPPFQSNFPTKSFSTATIRPGLFNEGLLQRQNEMSHSNGGLLPLRGLKDQFGIHPVQIPAESFPNLKRITPIPRSQRNPHNNTHTSEKEELPQINLRPNSKNTKLEPINSTKKHTESDQHSNNNDGFMVSNGHNNTASNQTRNSSPDTESLLQDGNKRPRFKGRSYGSYGGYDHKPKPGQQELMDPRYLLNQPQILTRRKPSESTIKNSWIKPVEKAEITESQEKSMLRNSTPVKVRTPLTTTKQNTPNISLADLMENKVTINFSFKSKAGALPGKPIKTNQDSYIVHTNFAGHKDKYIFAVCDGHGLHGHLVSNYVKLQLPKNIEAQYRTLVNEEYSTMKDALTSAFLKTNKELFESSIEVAFSGTTTVLVLLFNNRLWCANVGDSRAVIGKFRNGQWIASPLSKDHKPDLPKEKERIIAKGGRVDTFKDPYGNSVGPYRVWLKDENIPGLAMSRSLGDGVAAQAGCIPDPDILQFDLEEEDRFIIIASDGVWEFLSNQQVVDFVAPHYNKNHLETACEKVVREATLRWKEVEDEVVDDITCVVVSLRVPK